MNHYEELYFNTVRSLHRHLSWDYKTPFKQVFIPWPEDETKGQAFVHTSFKEELLFEYAYDSRYLQFMLESLKPSKAEFMDSILVTLLIETAIHETAHQRQKLSMLDEGWNYDILISYTQPHGYEWKKCMKELGVKRPKARCLGFDWVPEFKYPDLLQQIIDDISEDVWDVL